MQNNVSSNISWYEGHSIRSLEKKLTCSKFYVQNIWQVYIVRLWHQLTHLHIHNVSSNISWYVGHSITSLDKILKCSKFYVQNIYGNCSEAMTSSTHSFAYSYRCFQKCFVKICETSKCHDSLIFSTDFHQVFTVFVRIVLLFHLKLS